ncbi:MAG: SIR2 family protein [Bacteroidales bacterium]|nr:SIR2 family protein [Bacteroidales bacterium]
MDDIEIYLSEIAERLWSGHASLMVGAGFSMNAKKSETTTKSFPSWNYLGDCFYKKLYGKMPSEKDKCYLDALKLANEVEATFGRPALNKILRDKIPNMEYQPSELHEKLLQLPWVDVFTTNYDTLLERTAEKILEQRYETVINKEDLVWSTKPRIIKLHGSFPSERPFIITEEDYRKYPQEYAPFVNTVQQSLLENTLCLIGFSGNDPNFQKWIGWIIDNLGRENSPKIFLIGNLSLSVGQKKLLENRNIVLVDLYRYSDDYYKALMCFVQTIKDKGCLTENNFDYPKEESSFHFEQNNELKPQFEKVINEWKKTRLEYPNWLILPREKRKRLYFNTQNFFIYKVEDVGSPLDIKFLYEFNWRIEKCLFPISNSWIKHYENVIEKYNPFPKVISILDTNITPETDKSLEWGVITNCWIELQLSMLRYYREENLNIKWLALAEKIEKIKNKLSSDLIARYCYERCLYYLFLLDISSVRKELVNWASDTSLPYWDAKRAGLIAELGDIEQADKILEVSLNEIRNRLRLSPVKNDYALVSQEAYILQLSQYIRNSTNFRRGIYGDDNTKKYSERLHELIKYKCDPWGELKSFDLVLKSEPQNRKIIEKKYNFGIGSITNTHHLSKGSTYEMESYSFLRYIEEIGIPFKLPNTTLGIDAVKYAIPCVSNYSPNWGFISLIRTGDSKIIDDIFNRRSLSFFNQQNCDELANNYLEVLIKSTSEIEKGNTFNNATLAISLYNVIPEILSRLCTKCSNEVKLRILNLLKELYLSDLVNRSKYRGVDKLVEYLMLSFSLKEQYQLIHTLLEFPIIDQENYPDILSFIELENLELPNKIKVDNQKIDELISFLSEDNQYRKLAISRLILLWKFNLLNKTQINKFATNLWKYVDNYGFPKDTNYYYFAFISFPHPKDVNPKDLLKKYLRLAKLPIQGKDAKNISFYGGDIPIFNNILGTSSREIDYNWEKEDINQLILEIIGWWNNDKEYLKQTESHFFGSISDEFRKRFRKMIEIFSNVIKTNIKLLDSSLIIQIENILDELFEYGMPDLEAKVSFIEIFPNKKHEIYNKIKIQLYSKNEKLILDALHAISIIIISNDEHAVELLKYISENIKCRTEIGLDRFIESMKIILRFKEQLFTDEILNDLQIGLEFLLNEISINQEDNEGIVHKKMSIKQSSSYLLIALKKYYLRQNISIPQYINDWERMCLDVNEFSDIRNIWINNN